MEESEIESLFVDGCLQPEKSSTDDILNRFDAYSSELGNNEGDSSEFMCNADYNDEEIGCSEQHHPNTLPNFCKSSDCDELNAKEISTWASDDVIGKSFNSIANAEAFYRKYSECMGFGIRRSNMEANRLDGTVTMRRWVCNRQGKRRMSHILNTDRKRSELPHTRCGCLAAFVVRYDKSTDTFRVTTFNTEHNHDLAKRSQVHFFRSNREIKPGQAMEIRTMKESGIKTCQIMDFMVTALGGFDKVGFTVKDLYNFVSSDHERKKVLSTDAESTLAYFNALVDNDPGLYVRYAVDAENRLSRLFWTDSRSQMDYNLFGDVVVVDSTYKTNTFKMPLVEFVGVNNHLATIIFGCCLISEENVDAYTWAFNTFMHAMEGKQPNCIITDGDRAIAAALSNTMPQARHRLCSWHLMRNSRVVSTGSNFLSEFGKCMRFRYSVEEFENKWRSFLLDYNLVDNDWMKDLYEKKHKWAEAYFKGVFCAGMTTSQRCESTHAYMNRFLNTNLSLYAFVKQFCRAITRTRQTTLLHEFNNNQTEMRLETHLKCLEKTAFDFYSRAIFIKVRDEMEKETKYRHTKVEADGGHNKVTICKYGKETGREIIVNIRESDKNLVCSCGRFQSLGWPCRHMFCAMKAQNMTSIPPVMLKKRWAKKCSPAISDISANSRMTIAHPVEKRFGSLHAKVYQLCHVASASQDLYERAVIGIDNTISEILSQQGLPNESSKNKRRRLRMNCSNIIKDPNIVRTKGSQSENKTTKGKTRHCGICKKAGHYKSNCPLMKDDIGEDTYMESMNENDGEDLFY